MPLAPGTRLGPYEILAPLGAGGMGEVCKAKEARLARFVAVKLLPEPLVMNDEALARFEREAKAIAALNHPNVLGIHDFATHGEVSYVVMELKPENPWITKDGRLKILDFGLAKQRMAQLVLSESQREFTLMMADGIRGLAGQKGNARRFCLV